MRAIVCSAAILAVAASSIGCSEGTGAHVPVDGGPPPGPAVTWRESTPVDPVFIGSGGFAYGVGSATVGAAAPQGMVKVGPDTKGPWGTISFLHFSGYWYGDDTILGFSHLHLHGTGATDYGVLALMPTDAFDPAVTTSAGYASKFQKASESATPGHYAVTLDRGGIAVDLTATGHAAHHRYAYPAGAATGHVILDLDHHLDGGTVANADLTLYPDEHRFTGRLRSVGGMSGGFGGYDVFFEARTRAAWTESLVWHDGVAPAAGTSASGAGVGLALSFDVSGGSPIELQIGLSFVSAAEARKNLAAEMPNWSFDDTAKQTDAEWQSLLDTVRFDGGTEEQRNMMTASLYHLFLMPTVQSDVSGAYRGFDGQVHQADGFRYVTDLSLWDTYRTLHPLYSIIAPDRARDAVISMHEMGKQGGAFPKWAIATGDSHTMIGASAEVVVADAFLKGITNFDAEGAYAILRAAAMDPAAPPGGRGGRDWVEPYMKYGYVPANLSGRSVSHTTEYANDDFALAALAEGLGHTDDAATLRERAVGYRKLYDAETGFLWSRNDDGSWATGHTDPTSFSEEFTEANAWQSLWMVALDADGLAELAGGRAKLVAKLDEMFEKTKEDYEGIDFSNPLQAGAQRPYYWSANEPDINAAYMFSQLGRPDLTQKWVAWLRATQYTPGPDGLPGNDDGGTMSAWFVLSALGFYPLVGSDRYAIGAPLFTHAEIAVPGGTFTVDAPEVSDTNIYVQSVELNGEPLTTAEIRHADLRAGGSLVFHMGHSPSAWGRAL
ncbi:MAG: GH92 family glycosyl hydrolase [Minicystis sp.]